MAKIAKIEEVAESEGANTSVNLSGVFQARQSLRVKVKNGIAAIRKATIASEDAAEAIEETANAPLVWAAQGIASGLLQKDEFSQMLCDEFGAKPTKEGKPGKTPEGYGLTVRKRAVCLSEAIRIRDGEVKPDAFPKWAQGKDEGHISDVVDSLLSGDMAASVAYRNLTEKEKGVTVPLPFDAAKLTKIAEALADSVARGKIAESPALVAAYEAIALAWATEPAPIAF